MQRVLLPARPRALMGLRAAAITAVLCCTGAAAQTSNDGSAHPAARTPAPEERAGAQPLALASATASGQAQGGYAPCGISADGSRVAFMSSSSSLVANDTNGVDDVFVKDLLSGVVQRVSTSSSGQQWSQAASCRQMTPDGRHVLMQLGGTVQLKDVQTGRVRTVSPAADSIPENTGFSAGSVSDDGQRVAIVTVPTQTYQGAYQWVNTVPARIMVRNMASGELSTLDTDNGRTADGEIVLGHLNARLSPDGKRLAFVSSSAALVDGDTNGQADVFVRDLATGATLLASSSSTGVPAELRACCFQSYYRVEWANNSTLQFSMSQAHSLGPVGEYLKHLDSGELQLLLAASEGAHPLVTADLTTLVFTRLYGSGWDYRIFQRDQGSGAEQVVSSSTTGKPGNGHANLGLISRQGAHVVFSANSSNLIRPRPPAGAFQVYVKTIATTPLAH